MRDSYRGGARGAVEATGGAFTGGASGDGASAPNSSTTAASAPPAWAQRMKRSQTINHGATAAAHAVRSGDSHGGGASVNLAESDR